MKFFGRNQRRAGPIAGADPGETRARLDSALTAIFNEDGKRTVLYYLSNKFGLTLDQATVDPTRLEKALTSLLGEIGWMVVKRGILEQCWKRKIEMQEMQVVESASLHEAFGFIRGFGSLAFFKPA